MKYRPEVDGLRTIAVVPVVLFHLGYSFVPGGFVGVDIFFVISGFLISRIIYTEILENRFSLVDFYERRARRILPALFLVLLFCIIASNLIFMPRELVGFSESLIGVLTFSSNIFFWKESGYFSTASELKPLLHTWSLSVEEQFYIILPLILYVSLKYAKAYTPHVILFLAFISLAISEIASEGRYYISTAGYFLLPTRAWELFLGSILAIYEYNHGNKCRASTNSLMSCLGLVIILISILTYDRFTSFPGLSALLPTVGSCMIIYYAREGTVINSVFSNRIMVGVGVLSYSIYLWHQPLIAFSKYIYGELTSLQNICIIVATAAMSYLTWRYVETPFRTRKHPRSFGRKSIFLMSGFATAGLFAISLFIIEKGGFYDKLNSFQTAVLNWNYFDQKKPYRQGECFMDPDQTSSDFKPYCLHSESKFVVWGDSHAAALSSAFAMEDSFGQRTASGCPPLLGQHIAARPSCYDITAETLLLIEEMQNPVVLLHANWSKYEKGTVLIGLRNTLEALNSNAGLQRIIVLGGVPHWSGAGLPTQLALRSRDMDFSKIVGELYLESHSSRVLSRDRLVFDIAADYENVEFVSAMELFCKEGDRCLAATDIHGETTPLFWDESHLTVAGANFLKAKLFSL